MSTEFKRKIEDFVCNHCGASVSGNGYTNHCPRCLWSRHVDIYPGDRLAKCLGDMKPVSVFEKKGGYSITHECLLCGYKKNNKVIPGDNLEELVKISQNSAI